ncbi:MAG: phosphatase domain-containing protein [Candidatus Promineifilaceae bacterium]|nr:phosphatase domain-containing protein [Candidatus Promineifilaceae bacterium]
MVEWRKVLIRVTHDVESRFDELKYDLIDRLGVRDPVKILPYRGVGTPRRLRLEGRVLEDEGITPSSDNDSLWQNLLNTYRRVESDEVPGARVHARYGETVVEVAANREGFFEIVLEPPAPVPGDRLWHEIELELLGPLPAGQEKVTAVGQVLVPPPDARYGVISDIDDTVIQSHVGQLLRMARTVFLGNARTRLPFPGVAAFYRALADGTTGSGPNPLFFLSSSPWNLYDLLMEFFKLQEIPRAPTFLRNWGVSKREILPTENRAHKLAVLHMLLGLYPDLPFILIGDSSQQDPEIYHEIVHEFPGRILAVYIRNVTSDLERPEEIQKLADEVLQAESTLILADNTVVMAEHAAQAGWINPARLSEIAAARAEDEAEPSALEAMLGDEGEIVGEGEGAPPVIVEEGTEER